MWHNQPNNLISLCNFGMPRIEKSIFSEEAEEGMDTKYPF